MENNCDSEVANSSHSLSLQSEPPDIRNWFPNYRYESFVLDTYEFKESECGGDGFSVAGEKEGHLGESRRNFDPGDNHQHQPCIRTTDSSCSQSLLCEPPHIRNWFSSYVYESPLLDTLDIFKESVSVTKEHGREKGLAYERGKRNREDIFECESRKRNGNEVNAGGGTRCSNGHVNCESSFEDSKLSNEVPDSSESPSALSEPPDIKNWFFSSVYESPESGGLVDKGADCFDLVNQHNDNDKERSFKDDEKLDQFKHKGMRPLVNGNSSIQDNLYCERRQSLEDKIFLNHSITSANDLENESLSDDCAPCKLQKQNFLQEADIVTCQRNTKSSINDMASPSKLSLMKDLIDTKDLETKAEMGVDLTPPTTNMNFVQVSGDIVTKSTCKNNNKENAGEALESGFVTTKNRWKSNGEDSLHKSRKILSECSRNKRKISECRDNHIERKVLSKRTNLEYSDAIEITGKWQCPQKTKPNIGPPMKQLRLERWVHRL